MEDSTATERVTWALFEAVTKIIKDSRDQGDEEALSKVGPVLLSTGIMVMVQAVGQEITAKLVLELAERVKNRYRLSGSPSCQFWRRSINDLYLVQDQERKFVLRISPTDWRSYEQLAAEIDLLCFPSKDVSLPILIWALKNISGVIVIKFL